MKRLILISLCLYLGAPLTAIHGAESIPVDGFAARVNQQVITVGEVMSALQPIEQQLRTRYTGRELGERLEEAYERILNALIENALILEEFKQKEGQIPAQLVDEHIQGIVAENFDGDRGAFLSQLSAEGISMEEWRQDVRDRLAVMLLRREEVTPHVVISPRQVRQAYERRIEEFTDAGGTRVRMIMISRDDPEPGSDPVQLAKGVREDAAAGADFEELARAYSQDSRAERGGDWGWIDPEMLRPELAQAAKALEPGEVSEVIETEEALYIVHVEDRRPASVTPFSEVYDQLAQALRQAEEQRIYSAWIDRLKERFHVHIYPLPQSELNL